MVSKIQVKPVTMPILSMGMDAHPLAKSSQTGSVKIFLQPVTFVGTLISSHQMSNATMETYLRLMGVHLLARSRMGGLVSIVLQTVLLIVGMG